MEKITLNRLILIKNGYTNYENMVMARWWSSESNTLSKYAENIFIRE